MLFVLVAIGATRAMVVVGGVSGIVVPVAVVVDVVAVTVDGRWRQRVSWGQREGPEAAWAGKHGGCSSRNN